ncbi:hypothetical protein [Saccharomonospora piscinae]|uniref:hypothetical protein n=1 Tax=Saccharomonospora piscinae TaxID=687388 RepID=UPI0004671E26|nr:hypothetical protein [Saccharomonospora piscinae]
MYNGALADLNLSTNPWTGNRYAFTSGNPISGIEIDGHLWGWVEDTFEAIGSAAGWVGQQAAGFAAGVGEVASEVGESVVDLGESILECVDYTSQACADNVAAVGEAANQIASDPFGTFGSMVAGTVAPIVDDWEAGDYGEAVGRTVATAALGGGIFKQLAGLFDRNKSNDQPVVVPTTAADIEKALLRLPRGKEVRMVQSDAGLREFFKTYTVGSADITPKHFNGALRELPDGTTVGFREFSDSGNKGTAGHATINIKFPGGRQRTVHINAG